MKLPAGFGGRVVPEDLRLGFFSDDSRVNISVRVLLYAMPGGAMMVPVAIGEPTRIDYFAVN